MSTTRSEKRTVRRKTTRKTALRAGEGAKSAAKPRSRKKAPAKGTRRPARATAGTGIDRLGAEIAKQLSTDEVVIISRRGGRFRFERVRTPLGTTEIRRALSRAVATRARGRTKHRPGALTAGEKRLLAEGGFEAKPLGPEAADPMEVAAAEYTMLRRESYTARQTAGLLGVNDSRVRQRLTTTPPSLYGFKTKGGRWRVPRFQFDGDELVPGIEGVVARLGAELNPVSVWRWFTHPSPDLPADEEEERFLTPLEWLRTGRPPHVVADLAGDL